MSNLYPFILHPHPVYLKFGGSKLFDYGFRFVSSPKTSEKLAEVWAVSDLDSHSSVIANGPLQGKTLRELITEGSKEILGNTQLIRGKFPLMIRFLHINENLPPAIHPDHTYAEKAGLADPGKTEAGYVLEALPEAKFYYGLKNNIQVSQLDHEVQSGRSFEVMHSKSIRPGETYFVPPGKLHAWGNGSVLFELHTISNAIFALDWMDFPNKDAARRKFDQDHLKQSIRTDLSSDGITEPYTYVEGGIHKTILVACPEFTLEKWVITSSASVPTSPNYCTLWTVLEGEAKMSTETNTDMIHRSDTVLIPANCSAVQFRPTSKQLVMLKSYVGDLNNDVRTPILKSGGTDSQFKRVHILG